MKSNTAANQPLFVADLMWTMLSKGSFIPLTGGLQMPVLGLGTFQGSFEGNDDALIPAVKSAIDAGYRLIDTAQLYNTEAGVGLAVKEKINEGKITREDMFITTKLWSTAHKREDVVPSLKTSLSALGMDYVDLFLIHWPVALKSTTKELFPKNENGELIFEDDVDYLETWQGMEDVLAAGLTRAIGISNFNEVQVERLLQNCKIKPMNIQIESNPYFNNNNLIKLCQGHGIPVTGFAPLGKPHRTYQNGPGDPYIAKDPVLLEMASKYSKSPEQIALRFQIQRGLAIIPKSNTPSRILQNSQLFDFELTKDEMSKIEGLDRNFRVLWVHDFKPSRHYPFV